MKKRPSHLPILVVSGASGFIGRYFLEALREDFFIYALARRPQKAADVPFHDNISWIRVDIANKEDINRVIRGISESGGADFFLHLAGFFDFHNKNDPEYERTNVLGTKYILEAASNLNLKRFIFASSLAIFDVSDPSRIICEDSTPDATFPYAKTKREAEKLVRKFSSVFPCTVVRYAAIYSDWCEHLPLYSFLSTWLSNRWDHRILAGKGNTAITYLHINDLIRLHCQIIHKTDQLPRYHHVIASPDQNASYRELFQIAYTYSYFHEIKPICLPKWLAFIGLALRNSWGYIFNKQPFERIWMLKYVDVKMNIDASRTRKLLEWEPTKRYLINRRLLFLIWRMKTNPFEWQYRNKIRYYAIAERKYLKIYESMLKLRPQIVQETINRIMSKDKEHIFGTYQKLDIKKMTNRVEYIFKMLEFDICTGDRSHILDYAKILAKERYFEGFPAQEVMNAVNLTAKVIVEFLLTEQQLTGMKQRIYDEIMLTLQMVIDEIEDTYERLSRKSLLPPT